MVNNPFNYKVGQYFRLNWEINVKASNGFMEKDEIVVIVKWIDNDRFYIKSLKTSNVSNLFILYNNDNGRNVKNATKKVKPMSAQFLRPLEEGFDVTTLKVLYGVE